MIEVWLALALVLSPIGPMPEVSPPFESREECEDAVRAARSNSMVLDVTGCVKVVFPPKADEQA